MVAAVGNFHSITYSKVPGITTFVGYLSEESLGEFKEGKCLSVKPVFPRNLECLKSETAKKIGTANLIVLVALGKTSDGETIPTTIYMLDSHCSARFRKTVDLRLVNNDGLKANDKTFSGVSIEPISSSECDDLICSYANWVIKTHQEMKRIRAERQAAASVPQGSRGCGSAAEAAAVSYGSNENSRPAAVQRR